MSLGDLQVALGAMITAPSRSKNSYAFEGLELSQEERTWLDELRGARGFDVTCYIQRWWRETRLKWTVQMTLAALGDDGAQTRIDAYLDSVPSSSLFFVPEAIGFLDFVIQSASAEPQHLASIARFERALLIASEEATFFANDAEVADLSTASLAQHPAACVVEFDAPAEHVLLALFNEEPLPKPTGEKSYVLVAPGLSHLWRPATEDDVRIFGRCATPVKSVSLLADEDEKSINHMVEIGALSMARTESKDPSTKPHETTLS